MANAGEELTTDSVPDPPRIEIESDDDVCHNSDSDNSRDTSAKGQPSGKKTPPAQEKKRRNSKPNSKPQTSFGIPRINTPEGLTANGDEKDEGSKPQMRTSVF